MCAAARSHGCNSSDSNSSITGLAGSYQRHRPEETLLYKMVQAHWKTFLRQLESAAESPVLPAFVVSEMEAFIRCGVLAHGLILARCRDCGWCRAAGFSCQRRGFCPSCIGRRMCDFAARLVDRVMPCVPVRQWVLTVPPSLRAKLSFDPSLTTAVFRQFIAAVSAWLRRRARRLGVRGPLKTGAVTVIQRFNSALDASVHFHALILDGVYSFAAGRKPVFHPTPAPTDEDVAQVATAVWRRVERRLASREPSVGQRRFVESAPLLVAMAEASARGVIATGPRRGCRIIRVRAAPADVDVYVMGRLCAQIEGYNLQAATRLAANDREGLERMGRYLSRPPIAADRLSLLDDGRLELRLKRPWSDGTTALKFTLHELLERLVAQVPRPRANLVRYSGVLAPAFAARAQIVPSGPEVESARRPPPPPGAGMPKGPGRVPWAPLLWRVLLADVLKCGRCSARMQIVAAVTSPLAVTRILASMGLPGDLPTFHAARPPPQTELPFEDAAPGFEPDPPAPDEFGA